MSRGSEVRLNSWSPVPAILVSGRRGPFPSYRVNGIYLPEGHQPEALLYRRADAPAVSLQVVYDQEPALAEGKNAPVLGTGKLPTLVWELSGVKLAHSKLNGTGEGHLLQLEVQEESGPVPDPGILLVPFSPPASGWRVTVWTKWAWEHLWSPPPPPRWEWRQLSQLNPAGKLKADAAAPILPIKGSDAGFVLWGKSGSADPLVDLIQGDLGDCGVLSAIDSLAHKDPQRLRTLLTTCGGPDGSSSDDDLAGPVMARIFDPLRGERYEWLVSSLSVPAQAGRSVAVEVAIGTAVPRCARSLSHRSWGIVLEKALRELAGGLTNLAETEPGVAWMALAGARAAPKRYLKPQGQDSWLCAVPGHELQPDCRVTSSSSCCSFAHNRVAHSPDALEVSSLQRRPPARSERARADAWNRARTWKLAGPSLSDGELELLLEAACCHGTPLCIAPNTALRPDAGLGEPCCSLAVSFQELPPAEGADMTTIRFALDHAYSVRAAVRAQGSDEGRESLWLRLRDPRKVQLFWVQWRSVLAASDLGCYVYTCSVGTIPD